MSRVPISPGIHEPRLLFAEVRKRGCRRMRIDGELFDISEDIDLDEEAQYEMEVVIDRFLVRRALHKNLRAAVENGLLVGEGLLRLRISDCGLSGDDPQMTQMTQVSGRTTDGLPPSSPHLRKSATSADRSVPKSSEWTE